MARSFIEIIYIDSDDQAQMTDKSWSDSTNAETWAQFKMFREHAVDIKSATFLLDYHNAKGDLADTIPIDDRGFRAVTGQRPMSEDDYRAIDTKYWDDVRKSSQIAA